MAADGGTLDPALRDLTQPLIDHAEGQLFLNEAFKIIVEEVLRKGTDAKEKVSFEAFECLADHVTVAVGSKAGNP